MNWSRTTLFLVGSASFALGLLGVFAPSAVRGLPVDAAVARLGNDYFLVAAFGVAALVVVIAVLIARGVSGVDQATPPEPERVQGAERAGERFEAVVSDASPRVWLLSDRPDEVRERLRNCAVEAETRVGNCAREGARRRVERGTWTDDERAAAFLADGRAPGLSARLVAAVSGESSYQRDARRTAAAIANRYGRRDR